MNFWHPYTSEFQKTPTVHKQEMSEKKLQAFELIPAEQDFYLVCLRQEKKKNQDKKMTSRKVGMEAFCHPSFLLGQINLIFSIRKRL